MAEKGCLTTPGLMPKHEVKILMVPYCARERLGLPGSSVVKNPLGMQETAYDAGALSCSVMSDSPTPWTVADQAPLSMGFSR